MHLLCEFKTNNNIKNKGNQKISEKRVALVTGASRGIGEATALRLSHDGYSVAINYRNDKESASVIVNKIIELGGDAIAVYADITSRSDIKNMSEDIFDNFGRCDCIIHGASPPIHPIKTEEIVYDDMDLYLKTYLKGSIMLVEHFLPSMIQYRFGRFIFLGSSYLFGSPPPGMSAYVAAKEALWGYAKSLATDIGHYGITTNMVSPSLTVTELTSHVPARVKEVEAIKNPMRRLVTVNDTASQISYLCSDNANYINGINIPITGGPV